MKKLLLIGKAPGVEKMLRESAKRSGAGFVRMNTCAQARLAIHRMDAFEAVVMLVNPTASRLMLIEEIRGRFKTLPVFAAMRSRNPSDKALARAYGATGTFDVAVKTPMSLAQAFSLLIPEFKGLN